MMLHGPSARDLARLALARASSRLALDRAREAYDDASLAAFRTELRATVRHVSPFLVALLEGTGISVAEVARGLRPARAWPDRPGVPAHRFFFPDAAPARAGVGRSRSADPWAVAVALVPGVGVGLPDGVRLHVHVVDHSIEAAGMIGAAWFVSLFGRLSVQARGPFLDLPTLDAGLRLEEALEVPPGLRRGWLVERVSSGGDGMVGLAVRTGVRRIRLARPA